MPSTGDYGTVRVKRRVARSDSSVSSKSNVYINQAERFMRDNDTSSDDSEETDRESLDIEDVPLLPNDQVVVSSQLGVRDYFPVLLSEEIICLTYLR